MKNQEKTIGVTVRSKDEKHLLILGQDIKFNTEILETFAFSNWKPIIYDAMVVTAAIECADRAFRRPKKKPSYG